MNVRFPDRMPDTDRTHAIALAMDGAHARTIASDAPPETRALEIKIAYALGGLAFDGGIDYLADEQSRARLARYISPGSGNAARGIQRDAERDPQTGLGNRSALDRALPRANGHPNISVLMFDGDNFGQINKKVSWNEGDRAIIDLGACIKATADHFGCGERVFRRGEKADEFLVIARSAVADALCRSIVKNYGARKYGAVTVRVTGAVGNTDAEAQANLIKRKAEHRRALPARIIHAVVAG